MSSLTPAQRHQREQAATKHGLYARTRSNVRVRHYRASRLLGRLQEIMPIYETQLPIARAWAEHEVLATDAYSALMAAQAKGETNEKLLQSYLAIRRAQLAYSKELGLTPAAQLGLRATSTTIRGAEAAQAAQERLQARYSTKDILQP